MNDNFEKLSQELNDLIDSITPDLKPEWGSMTLVEMLKHITTGLELSASYRQMEIITPEEQIPAFQKFLLSDRNFKKGSPVPKEYALFPQPDQDELSVLKDRLREKFHAFRKETEENNAFWSEHPNFGRMDALHTRALQYKHIMHHFNQFNIGS